VTVRKGEDWGAPGDARPDLVVVAGDAEAAAVVAEAEVAGRPCPPIGLLGGDLRRVLGGRGDEASLRAGGTAVRVDLGVAHLDGERHLFVAHLVARRARWRGRFAVVMNAEHVGDLDLAPRAHPGDGRLDVVEGRLRPGDRLKARARARTGTHLPHPDLRASRPTDWTGTWERPVPVRLDGRPVGRFRTVEVTLRPDAIEVVV